MVFNILIMYLIITPSIIERDISLRPVNTSFTNQLFLSSVCYSYYKYLIIHGLNFQLKLWSLERADMRLYKRGLHNGHDCASTTNLRIVDVSCEETVVTAVCGQPHSQQVVVLAPDPGHLQSVQTRH
jgi:hypothetical protein